MASADTGTQNIISYLLKKIYLRIVTDDIKPCRGLGRAYERSFQITQRIMSRTSI
jgi:hypothetical protein